MKKIKIIALIGKSGAGKDYWLQKICENHPELYEIVSCTTRPARWMEINGKNYYFLTEKQFMSEKFLESCMFKGWRYGTRYSDIDKNKINIGVFNLSGVEQLLANPEIDLTVIYIYAEDKTRLIRQLQRDSSDIDEIFRRYYADEKDFSKDRIERIEEQATINTIFNEHINEDENEFIFSDIEQVINQAKGE